MAAPHLNLRGINPLRAQTRVRAMLSTARLRKSDLVMPLLVVTDAATPNPHLPTFRLSQLAAECTSLYSAGIRAVKIFGAALHPKDHSASEAVDPDNLLLQAIRVIRATAPELCIISDACVCSFTADGQCTLVKNGGVDLRATLRKVRKMSLLQADAGADFIAPSAMLDGAVRTAREALDKGGFRHVGVFPHLIIDSCLYDGYRAIMKAQGPTGSLRRDHLQLPASSEMQIVETARQFEREGATAILLEPAMFAMDLLPRLRKAVKAPLAAFSVSGEYRMLCAAGDTGVAPRHSLFLEAFSALKRAGADLVFTYASKEIAHHL